MFLLFFGSLLHHFPPPPLGLRRPLDYPEQTKQEPCILPPALRPRQLPTSVLLGAQGVKYRLVAL